MEIPNTFTQIAESNVARLKKWFPSSIPNFSYYQGDKRSVLDVNRKMLAHIRSSDDKQTSLNGAQLEVVDFVLKNNLAAILIRPEMFHARGQIMDFLKQNGLIIAYTHEFCVSYTQYCKVCEDTIGLAEAIYNIPTRSLVYTAGQCLLVLLSDQNCTESLADKVVRELKGTGGIYNPNTIRGGIVYQEASRLGFNTLSDPTLQAALDPAGIYRWLVKSPLHKALKGSQPEDQLLKYNAISVHVPDQSEMKRDLILLPESIKISDIKI